MLVNLTRSDGDTTVTERIEAPVDFEGSGAQEGVLVNFPLDGRDVTGRITRVLAPTADQPDAEPAIDVTLIDREALDVESEITLAELPPRKDEFGTEL
jgi:hypothetical protein